MSSSTPQLSATYYGFIGSTYDALILFEACLSGRIAHVARRPHDRERETVIKSGRVFIYEEHSSGIKRWTDGISWSPSRILGNFLIYRQLVRAFGPGEKKKAIKKPKGPVGITKNVYANCNNRPNRNTLIQSMGTPASSGSLYSQVGQISAETERALIGSLTDSYDFLEDGLVKKTISITLNDVTHHLVSYYTIPDVMADKFMVPSKDPRFANLQPRPALLTAQNFRSPIEDVDPMDRSTYPSDLHDISNRSIMHDHQQMMPAPEIHSAYAPAPSIYTGNYGMPAASSASSAPYENNIPAYSSMNYTTQFVLVPGVYPAPPRNDQYDIDNFRSRYNSAQSSGRVQAHAIATQRNAEDLGVSLSLDHANIDFAYTQNQTAYSEFPSDDAPSSNNMVNGRDVLSDRGRPNYLHQATYSDEPYMKSTEYRISMDCKTSSAWEMGGNSSVGHGHYQQQRARPSV
jgi:Gti1/Pac2 family transcription factor